MNKTYKNIDEFKDRPEFEKHFNGFSLYFTGNKTTLENCNGCFDCENCNNCLGCENCKSCLDCDYCQNCKSCRLCFDCKYSKLLIDCKYCNNSEEMSSRQGYKGRLSLIEYITPKNNITIAIDFDGTCVVDRFPKIGSSCGAESVLRDLIKAGHKLILSTMRSDKKEIFCDPIDGICMEPGDYLTQAVNWFKNRDILLYGININPTQNCFTDSPKVLADLYIDDRAVGIPTVDDLGQPGKKYVNWECVRKMLVEMKVL